MSKSEPCLICGKDCRRQLHYHDGENQVCLSCTGFSVRDWAQALLLTDPQYLSPGSLNAAFFAERMFESGHLTQGIKEWSEEQQTFSVEEKAEMEMILKAVCLEPMTSSDYKGVDL